MRPEPSVSDWQIKQTVDRLMQELPGAPVPARRGTPPAPLPRDPVAILDRGERLEQLTDKALAKMDEILDLPLEEDSDHFPRVLSAQKDAAGSVLTLAARVDENRFRRKSTEALQSLLQMVSERETALEAVVLDQNPQPAE